MDLKYLNTFRVIVEEGGFSKAADRLGYTQSTITFQIGQLEQELSTSLFEKIGRRMVLTKAGEHLIPYVNEVLSSVDRLRNFEDDLAECQGDLRVGVGETLLCFHLPAILKEFHKKAPKARLFLRSMNCYDIRDELVAGSLDIGVFYNCVGGFGTSLTTYFFGTYSLALVASQKTKKQYRDFITTNQQIPVPFIINEPSCVFRQLFEQYLREKSIMLDHTIELWSIPTIKNLVKNDVGISYLPRFSVQEELSDGSLVEIPTELTETTITAVCGHHKNKWISPLMQLFIDLCAGASN
ncbi:LysR family transcriptional regulator [Dorea sp. D27]|uniref:LysR family transcriptional regulator n=1 Tax=Dorea sp. D27 TaxID=658665 RepID=UPI0006730AEB|nr:LysR family transcriptional regulator [Dorea sp. D27]KMZ55458.1 transcriptional regulator, LysR family [Dorea sp. D27]